MFSRVSPTSGFGTFGQQQQQQQTGFGGFGSSTGGGGMFGSTGTTGGFGSSTTGGGGIFGSPPAAGGFGSTGTAGTSSLFGSSTAQGGGFGTFGQRTTSGSAFGGAGTTGTSSIFGSSVTSTGTASIRWREEVVTDVPGKIQSISILREAGNKALEELRWEDYQKGVTPGSQPADTQSAGASGGFGSGFGQQTTGGTSIFGSTSGGFGQTSGTGGGGFLGGASTGTAFGEGGRLFGSTGAGTGTGLFGSSTQATGTGFGQSTMGTGSIFGGAGTTYGQGTGTSGGIFGNTGSTTGSTTGSLFGSKPAGGLFGGTTGGSLFGSSTGAATTGGSIFGNTGTTAAGGSLFATKPAGTSLFGTTSPAFGDASAGTGTGFGGGTGLFANKPSTGTSLFGNTSAGGGGLFGNTGTAASTGGLFGNAGTATTGAGFGSTGTSTGGLFGTTTQATGGGLFGSAKPAGSLFGSTGAASTGGLFGAGTTGGGLFGSTGTATGGTGLFGSATTGSSLFGGGAATGTSTTGGLFGSSTGGLGGLFGQKPTTGSGTAGTSLFGTPAGQTSIFGGAAAAQPTTAPAQPATPYDPHGVMRLGDLLTPQSPSISLQQWFPDDAPVSGLVLPKPYKKLWRRQALWKPLPEIMQGTCRSVSGARRPSISLGPGEGSYGWNDHEFSELVCSARRDPYAGTINSPSYVRSHGTAFRGGETGYTTRSALRRQSHVSPLRSPRRDRRHMEEPPGTGSPPSPRSRAQGVKDFLHPTSRPVTGSMQPSGLASPMADPTADDDPLNLNFILPASPVGMRSPAVRSPVSVRASSAIDIVVRPPEGEAGEKRPKKAPRVLVPILTKEGYRTEPSLEVLSNMSEEELSAVRDFKVVHEKHGSVHWPGCSDLRGLNLDLIVTINNRSVEVYGDGWAESDGVEPAEGQGLNKEAIVTLNNCLPKAYADGRPIPSDVFSDVFKKHERKLRDYTVKLGGEFLDLSSGWTWQFRVSHF